MSLLLGLLRVLGTGETEPEPQDREAMSPHLVEQPEGPGLQAPVEAVEDYQREIRRHLVHNTAVTVLIYQGIWEGAFPLRSQFTMLPVLLDRLGASGILIGLIRTVEYAGLAPMIFSAHLTAHLPQKKRALVLLHLAPLAAIALVGVFALLSSPDAPLRSGLLILAAHTVFCFGAGFIAPVLTDLQGRLIPESDRGRYFGMFAAIGSVTGFGGAFLANRVLGGVPFPANFGVSFLVAAAITAVGVTSLVFLKEPAYPYPIERQRFRGYFGDLMKTVRKDHDFQLFLVGRVLYGVGYMSTAFFAPYAVSRFGLPDKVAATFSAMSIVGVLVSSYFWGWVGERIGYCRLAALCGGVWVVATLLIGWGPAVWASYVAFALLGMGSAMANIYIPNLVLGLCPLADRGGYVSVHSLITGPIFASLFVIAGALVDTFSHATMFAVSIAGFVGTLLVFLLLVKEPRRFAAASGSGQSREGDQ